MMKALLNRLLGSIWLVLLGLALLLSAAGAYVRSMQIEEYAWGCDPFGYLRMAKEVRRGAALGQLPDYRLESLHTRLLIDFMRSQDVPPSWGEMVAPHAHHYFPRTGSVAVQYPPGTGLLLACFPQGEAAHGLNQAVILVFLTVGLLVLVVAGRTQSWAAAGSVVFALQFGLKVLDDIGTISYSINAALVPLLLSFSLLFLALVLRSTAGKPRAAWVVALLAGACFGFAILVRLPVLFLLPGALILLLGTSWRTFFNSTVVAFGLGVGLCGVLPLLAHQHQVAGAWHLSTYGQNDSAPPSLSAWEKNIPFYFQDGPGSQYNWALLVALVGSAGLAALLKLKGGAGENRPLSWDRLVLSAFLIWGVSTAYFLTHQIAIFYYQTPAVFAAVLVFALGGLTIQCCARKAGDGNGVAAHGSLRRLACRLALLVAFLPGLVALEQAWPSRPRSPLSTGVATRHLEIPAELADPRAWVFADLLTGQFWYYSEQSAHKVRFTDARTRALTFRFVFDRGEPMYVIRDCDEMQLVLNEIEQMGGVLEPRGKLDGRPYFLIRWPEGGPRSPHVPRAR